MNKSFEAQAESFALDIMETLALVLPKSDLGLDLAEVRQGLISLSTNDPKGIELQIDQKNADAS